MIMLLLAFRDGVGGVPRVGPIWGDFEQTNWPDWGAFAHTLLLLLLLLGFLYLALLLSASS